MTEWQPIETIPKDNRTILIALRNGEMIIAQSAVYAMTKEDKTKIYRMYGLWPDANYTPTHWMPLPSPPILAESVEFRDIRGSLKGKRERDE